ncbi:MAG: ATP-grasp domain-containing protein [Pseudonocardiales bacterium]|nr:ATP-grasp domain-containing protein [Pseudonocardiales bacterium]MBV9730192.1 ATP-grasp domain-containing protein [Pseudonocardiales bacterium]
MTLGIARNPYATNVPTRLVEAAAELDIPVRVIDLPTLTVDISLHGEAVVRDTAGAIDITSLAPYLLFGYPTAVHAFRILCQRAYMQNPVDSVLTADDKAATAIQLSHASLPQVPSTICSLDLERTLSVAEEIQYPVVIKRTHGAHGRWVRRAEHAAFLTQAFYELKSEGPGALILQPEVAEFYGRSIRAVITGGHLLAATLRTATGNEWRSNIAGGAMQYPVDLTPNERTLAENAARTLGLGHAGIDIVRTARGPLILEVNSCPDFTSMLPFFDEDLTRAVLLACLPSSGRIGRSVRR